MVARGTIVAVIGGSSGIGFEIARQLDGLGARLVLAGRDGARLARAADSLGGRATTTTMDAHEEGVVERFFSQLEPVDHVVSMVGDSMSGGFMTTPPETMRHVLHSKFWTNWMIARHAATHLRDGGSLVFTSGTGGRPHEVSATFVANLAIEALVRGLASELSPRARVNAVAPTFMGTRTSFWRGATTADLDKAEAGFAASVPLERIATVEEVASAYVYLMSNDFITGQVLAVDGGVMLRK